MEMPRMSSMDKRSDIKIVSVVCDTTAYELNMKKPKPMKRLPPNWAERLTIDDVDEILEHFRIQHDRYTNGFVAVWNNEQIAPWPKQAAIVAQRLTLWAHVRAEKLSGHRVQSILDTQRYQDDANRGQAL